MNKMHKFGIILATIAIAILLAYTAVALYFNYGYTGKTITYNEITVDGEEDIFEAGDKIDIHYDRCSNGQYPAHIEYVLVSNDETALTEHIGALDVVYTEGCTKFIGNSIVLPFSVLPGEYRLKLFITYEIDWLFGLHKTNSLVEYTEPFYVVNPFAL